MMRVSIALAFATGIAIAPVTAQAAVTFSAQAGALAASVSFDVLPGSKLQVVLTNTSLTEAAEPMGVLTAVFFSGLNGLTPTSALLAAGSTVINTVNNTGIYANQQPPGDNVGGEWAYNVVSGLPNGASAGISSSGLGIFGGANFNGPNLQNPVALDGMQYGIVPASSQSGGGNGGMDGNAFIRNSVVFVLDNYTGGAAGLAGINNLSFQYGTALSEPNLVPNAPPPTCSNGNPYPYCGTGGNSTSVPEPMSAMVLTVGLLGLGLMRRQVARRATT